MQPLVAVAVVVWVVWVVVLVVLVVLVVRMVVWVPVDSSSPTHVLTMVATQVVLVRQTFS